MSDAMSATDGDGLLERVLSASISITEDLGTTTVLQRVVDAARELLGARYAALGVRSEDGRSLADFIHSGMPPEQVAAIGALPTGRGVLGLLLTEPEPLRLADLTQHPASVGFPEHHPVMNSFVGAPIVRRGKVLGNLYVTEKDDGRSFTRADEVLLDAFAGQAAVAIENARLYADTARRAHQAQVLVGATSALVRIQEPRAVVDAIVAAARDLTGATYAAVGLFSGDELTHFTPLGLDDATAAAIGHPPVGRGVIQAVRVERRPLRLDDMRTYPASVGVPAGHPELTTFLGVPVMSGDAVSAAIYLANKTGGFSEDDEELVVALAGQAAVAIERASAQAREAETVASLHRLLEANLALTRNLDPVLILQEIVDLARELVHAEYAALGVLDPEGRTLERFIHSGIDAATVERIGPLPTGRGVLGAVIHGRRPMRLANIAEHPASIGFPAHHPPMSGFIGVPLQYQGETLGNLYLTNKVDGTPFDADDEALVHALAAQAAVAIQNAKVYDRERHTQRDLAAVNQQLERFAYIASHDLREPLRMITSFLSRLKDRYGDQLDERATRYIDESVDGADRLKQLLDALLSFSQLQRRPVSLETVRVTELTRQLMVDLGVMLEEEGASVTIVGELPDVRADEALLTIVLQNLVRNAVKFRQPDVAPAVLLDGRRKDGDVVLGVEDNGIGIEPAYRERVFRMFERLHSRSEYSGTGIGLTTVAMCTERMHGRVAVVDPIHGDGARIEITLGAPREQYA